MNTKNLSKTVMMLALIFSYQSVSAQNELPPIHSYDLSKQTNGLVIATSEKFRDIPSVTQSVSYTETAYFIESFVEICESKTTYIFSRDFRNLNIDIVTPRGKYLIEIQKSKNGEHDYLIINKINLDSTNCLLAQDRSMDGFQKPKTNEYTYFQSGSRCESGVMEITSIKPKILSEIDRKYLGVILYLKEIMEQS